MLKSMTKRENELKEAFKFGVDNGKKLNRCAGPHEFVSLRRLGDDRTLFGCEFKCVKCDGYVNALAVGWYNMGLAHGRSER